MAEKKYKGAPFGVQTARFDVSGVHPKNKVPGTFTEIAYDKNYTNPQKRKVGPGLYNVDVGGFSAKSVEERSSGPGWARQYEVEQMAALPHLLHKDQWLEQQNLKRKLGPGSYNIKDFLQLMENRPQSVRSAFEAKSNRFGREIINNLPGPGTYGVPHAILEEKAHRSPGNKGLLDSSGNRSIKLVGCELGPGTYEFQSSIDQLVNKVVGNRGPYDIFTSERNKPITTGHCASPRMMQLGPGQYEIKSFMEEFSGEHKIHKGKFGTVAQYPDPPTDRIYNATLSQYPRNIGQPGPGSYNPKVLSKHEFSKKLPGFLSSSERVDRRAQRFFTGNFNPVGAGRYDVQKYDETQHQNGHQSNFKSKTTKRSLKFNEFLKERLRGKDVPLAERSFLVEPQGLPAKEINHVLYNFANQRSLTVM